MVGGAVVWCPDAGLYGIRIASLALSYKFQTRSNGPAHNSREESHGMSDVTTLQHQAYIAILGEPPRNISLTPQIQRQTPSPLDLVCL
jgi:hypothetical protein